MTPAQARESTLALIAARAIDATVCPSEVARAITAKNAPGDPESWRDAMPIVHAAVDRLLAEGLVQLTWKGKRLSSRAGPYRIGRNGSG